MEDPRLGDLAVVLVLVEVCLQQLVAREHWQLDDWWAAGWKLLVAWELTKMMRLVVADVVVVLRHFAF